MPAWLQDRFGEERGGSRDGGSPLDGNFSFGEGYFFSFSATTCSSFFF